VPPKVQVSVVGPVLQENVTLGSGEPMVSVPLKPDVHAKLTGTVGVRTTVALELHAPRLSVQLVNVSLVTVPVTATPEPPPSLVCVRSTVEFLHVIVGLIKPPEVTSCAPEASTDPLVT
jgi:hypothetical protein